MFEELRERVVLVTGGASGIGAGIVEAFLSEGSTVIGADLSVAGGGLHAGRDREWSLRLDVTDERAVEAALDRIEQKIGRVDVLVTAAGTSTLAFAVDTSEEEWDLNLRVNAKGSFLVAKHVAKRLVAAGRTGRIVFISSQAGKNGYRGMTAYVASKHAVLGVTKTMAVELAPHGILVNAICPGIIETPMKHRERIEGGAIRGMTAEEVAAEDRSQVPLGRTGTPGDVAGVALFLASDLSAYMTGQGINVTGGMTMH
ncbi:SDR family NAD(P)-dependent oxidoreductase [Microbacterium sp. XT11]|uniref:SDR family NAD(P)-dependent oxidoreductase n=1 Tax=Microbacterium sp. XT11 TaxID=367477 RepID=UPI000742F916|nr:SDR family NAD(P)-dependent oxidoreductase [Microbacterium sp. XT11]ALX66577.1 oxidoreductase [Microbacterium sp. XT11]